MYELNPKIRGLTPYDPISGEYRVRLDANESFFPLPPEVRGRLAELAQALDYNRYPDPAAAGFCEAFAAHYGVDPALVTAGNGSDELLFLLTSAFLMRGGRMAVLSPDFSMYRFYASLAEAECLTFRKDGDLRIPVDRLISFCQEECVEMLLFSNPCNPTSLGLSREEVRRLVRSVDALVVLDEAYMDFWDQSLLQEAADFDNLIILRTCSKAFGMAALRVGAAVANPVLTRAIRAVKSPYNVNSFSQAAAAEVLRTPGLLDSAREAVVRSREELYQGCAALASHCGAEAFRPCTNFVLLRLANAPEVHRALLARGIAVRLIGDAFLRITAGAPEENCAVLGALEDLLTKGRGA